MQKEKRKGNVRDGVAVIMREVVEAGEEAAGEEAVEALVGVEEEYREVRGDVVIIDAFLAYACQANARNKRNA
jgi:hypothetical protein